MCRRGKGRLPVLWAGKLHLFDGGFVCPRNWTSLFPTLNLWRMSWLKFFWKAATTPPTLSKSWNVFSPRAHQVLALAGMEARRFNHSFIGTEHVLLGLIKLGQGTGVGVLSRMGVNLETVRLEVEKQIGP